MSSFTRVFLSRSEPATTTSAHSAVKLTVPATLLRPCTSAPTTLVIHIRTSVNRARLLIYVAMTTSASGPTLANPKITILRRLLADLYPKASEMVSSSTTRVSASATEASVPWAVVRELAIIRGPSMTSSSRLLLTPCAAARLRCHEGKKSNLYTTWICHFAQKLIKQIICSIHFISDLCFL